MEDMRKISRLSNYTINDITAVWGDQEEGDQEEGDQEERRERRQALYHDVQELCLGRSSDPTRTLTLLRWVLPIKSDRKRPSVVVVLGGQTTVEFGHNSTTAPLSFDPPMNGPMSRFYKESLKDVLMPTLKSVMRSRNHYIANTQGTATCNIVVCDDGMMAFLKDNFAAAEMLWETICATEGKMVKLSKLLQQVPRPSRRHLKGLKSHAIYEVFHRMLFYYHHQIGFCARSTHDRRGKFKKASNLNSHLRLAWGAEQLAAEAAAERRLYGGDEDGDQNGQAADDMAFEEALIEASHNGDGSRYVMFGNNIEIGDLIIVNDADARMAPSVILKTVPEFLNDPKLGFTQHATKVRTYSWVGGDCLAYSSCGLLGSYNSITRLVLCCF